MKYHVSKDGTPGICTAKGPCPLGGEENHFDTYQEAKDFGQEQLEKEYGILSKVAEEATPYEYVEPKEGEKVSRTTKLMKEYNEAINIIKSKGPNIDKTIKDLSKESNEHERKALRAIRKDLRANNSNMSTYDVNKKANAIYARTDEAVNYKKEIRNLRNDRFAYTRVSKYPEYLDNLKDEIDKHIVEDKRQEQLSKEAKGSKIVLRDGDLDVTHNYLGTQVRDNYKIDEELTVDEDGNINNLFLVSNDGKIDKVVKINEHGNNFTLDNGEKMSLYHTSTSRQGIMKRQSYNIQVGEPSGETYDGFKEIHIDEVDTSD